MADIRNVGSLGAFADQGAADDTQAFPNGPTAPWFTVPGASPVEVSAGGLTGTEFPPTSSNGYYAAVAAGGDGVEMWGLMSGSPAETAGWRFGLYTVASIVAGAVEGYQCLPHNPIGGTSISIRRYDDGEFTTIASDTDGGGGYALMRRNGVYIEVWQTMTLQTENWTLRLQVEDTTYVDEAFYATLGTTGTETGWEDLGFGVRNRPHIYRWLGSTRLDSST